jgi:putative membrane protein
MKSRLGTGLLLTSIAAWGHTGEPLEPHDLWSAWSLDPGIVIPLALVAILFAAGARTSRGVSGKQFVCFWSGWIFLALALVSPLHPLGEALFSAHMAQHEILMLIAAPLLVLSRPLVPILWGLPIEARKVLGQWSKRPPVSIV